MKHIKIGITQGDINGVGYEVIMKVLAEQKMYEGKTVIVYGSPKVAAYHRKSLDLQNFNFNLITTADEAAPKRPNIINCVEEEVRVDVGTATVDAGKAAIKALSRAIEDLKADKIDVLIPMPVNKESMRAAGVDFSNHTEYLAKAFGTNQHSELFVNGLMRLCYVSKATNVSQVAKTITKDAVLEKIVALNDSLQVDFGVQKPKIAVLALNSEFADEEKGAIAGAISDAKNSGFVVVGPYLAEEFFADALYKKFDGVVGMYRDQVAVPFKAMSYDNSVEFSLGLPKICITPTMGVGYAQVEKNCAEESPLVQALFTAADLTEKRDEYAQLTKNKLK